MSEAIVPNLISMFICDEFLPSDAGKFHLAGCFDAVRLPEGASLPYHLERMCVVCLMTNGLGTIPFHLEVSSLDTDQKAFASPVHEFRFADRLRLEVVCFRLTQCPFREPGIYSVELRSGNEFVTDRRLRVIEGGLSDV